MKIRTSKNGAVTINGITQADLRLWVGLMRGHPGSFDPDHIEMVVRLIGMLSAAASYGGTVQCAPSTTNPAECYIDELAITEGVRAMQWTGRLPADGRSHGDTATVAAIEKRYRETRNGNSLTGLERARLVEHVRDEITRLASIGATTPSPLDVTDAVVKGFWMADTKPSDTEYEWLHDVVVDALNTSSEVARS